MKTTIDMALESKVVPVLLTPHGEYFTFLERFEALVRADEREVCAKLAEQTPKIRAYGESMAVQDYIAAAIRNREKP
jgi:hypothetical protein